MLAHAAWTTGVPELVLALGTHPTDVLRILKAAYGLSTVPRTFWRDLKAKLEKDLSELQEKGKDKAENLQAELDKQLQQRQARETGICPVREELYDFNRFRIISSLFQVGRGESSEHNLWDFDHQ